MEQAKQCHTGVRTKSMSQKSKAMQHRNKNSGKKSIHREQPNQIKKIKIADSESVHKRSQ